MTDADPHDENGQDRKTFFMRWMLYGAVTASIIILLSFAGLTVMLFYLEPPEASRQLVAGLVTTFQTLAILAAGYWFQQRQQATRPPPPNPPAPPKT